MISKITEFFGIFSQIASQIIRSGFFLVLILFLFFGCIQPQKEKIEFDKTTLTFIPSNISITVMKADTKEKINNGLMFRTSPLNETEGMLFYMNSSAYHAFWMVNTKIPLEVIFIDGNFTIVDIQEMEPCNDSGTETRMPNCTLYISKLPSFYVLEVNQNFSKKYLITENSRVKIE